MGSPFFFWSTVYNFKFSCPFHTRRYFLLTQRLRIKNVNRPLHVVYKLSLALIEPIDLSLFLAMYDGQADNSNNSHDNIKEKA